MVAKVESVARFTPRHLITHTCWVLGPDVCISASGGLLDCSFRARCPSFADILAITRLNITDTAPQMKFESVFFSCANYLISFSFITLYLPGVAAFKSSSGGKGYKKTQVHKVT